MDAPFLIDISQPVSPASGHFEGDTPFQVDWPWRMARGASCDVARVTTSPHVGSHADAPSHYLPGAPDIASLDLTAYLGPCQLLRVEPDAQISADELQARVDVTATPRILFCGQGEHRAGLPGRFAVLELEAIDWAARHGVLLFGTDAPSVDPVDSKDLPRHKAMGAAGIRNLENLALSHVLPGRYELIALPLRWVGLEAAPVRAVLRELGQG